MNAGSPLQLPAPAELERICKGLAALDAMLCEEWQDRYYSFNHQWSETADQRMASMRNGQGDEWFMVFEAGGVFLKAFWHEYDHENAEVIYADLPASLRAHATQLAFSMEWITFGGWYDGTKWSFRGEPGPMTEQLQMLAGDPETYRAYAADYFDATVPVDAIAHVLAGKKLDEELVNRISTQRTFAQLQSDLDEIAY